MNKLKRYAILLLLTFASLCVLGRAVSNDPYYTFLWKDCLEQVGIGSALITAWTLYGIRLVRGVSTRQLNGFWVLAILWSAIAVFYLGNTVQGYISDIRYFQTHKPWEAPIIAPVE